MENKKWQMENTVGSTVPLRLAFPEDTQQYFD